MRFLILLALALLAGCGGDSSSSAPPPAPAPTPTPTPLGYDPVATIAALKSHSPLPPYPLGPPSYVDPPVNGAGIIIDARFGTVNPTLVARYALYKYHVWVVQPSSASDDKLIDVALQQTDWLAANIDCKNGIGVWRHDFDASFEAKPGWTSSFTNAHGIAALLIMARFIDDPQRYLDPAVCALNAFEQDVANGGLKTTTGNGYIYEEYATPMRSGVMNGHVFALAGLYYACTYAKPEKACGLFDDGIAGLKHNLPKYDARIISKYSLVEGNFANPAYNELGIAVLEWLDFVRPDPVIKQYIAIFQDYAPEQFQVTASFSSGPDYEPGHLTDGLLWYNYWSSYVIPVTLDFDLGSDQYIRALGISFVGENAGHFQYAIIESDGSEGTYFEAPVPTIAARHTVDVHRSTVGIYDLGVRAQRLRIRFTAPTTGDVVALREINVLH